MQDKVQLRKEAIEEIFITLAEFYKMPNEHFFDEVNNGSLEKRLKELFAVAGYNYPSIVLKGRFASFKEMKQSYMNCFMGVIQPYAAPIESVYKVWTTDPSAEMGMAKEKGYVFGDSALHIRHLFEHYQLEIPEEYKHMPDHLTLLLEFLVFLLQNGSKAEIYQFLTDHFDWLEDFNKELQKLENSAFYVNITKMAIEATCYEINNLKESI